LPTTIDGNTSTTMAHEVWPICWKTMCMFLPQHPMFFFF
jgi:hypothetical protein